MILVTETISLEGWSFEQLNPYSSLFKKDEYVINVKLVNSPDVGICNVVDIYKNDQFLSSRDTLEEALLFVNNL